LSVSKDLHETALVQEPFEKQTPDEHLGAMAVPGVTVECLHNAEIEPMTIQAVFFDMGGTIETFGFTRESRLRATPEIQRRLRSAGIELDLSNERLLEVVSDGLERYHQWSLESLEELPPSRVWQEYILAGRNVDPGRLSAIAEDLMLWIETRYYDRQMRPEVPAVLDAIQRMGLKIGLISNVCSRGQVPTNLDRYRIRHYFNPVVLSSVYGRRKPDPAIFHYAARLANVATSECVYVGDRISRDIVGSQRAGYALSIQIKHDYEHGEDDGGATPDHVIGQMTELVDILRAELDLSSGRGKPPETTLPNQIRALLFDAGDILYHRPRKGGKLKEYLKGLALADENVPAGAKRALARQAFQGQISQDQYWEALLRLYGVTQPERIDHGKRILEEEENDIEFFPAVRETLDALKERGFLLGIVTDTANPVHVKLSWLARGGIGDVWDSIISSRELGVCKPDPRIFQAALRQLGLTSEQAAFVGHDASELEGAEALGMSTIAFNCAESARADFHIERFDDLLQVPIVARSNQVGIR
jgi:putative hydrolase of the HAD superfamily